ncbi:MAG TPA: IpaD/SipD/SspD family type III secretion system needle tip protein, partial [Pararobbsia sp.]|nr:IpaD/SipD/SspD family type III secretion system needle tip protein [Pararobbsia sp.]
SAYTALMEDVGDLSALQGPSQSAGSDANHIKFDVRAVQTKLEAMLKHWSNETVYGPAPIEQIQRLAEQWRLPFEDLGNGTGVVKYNVKPIEIMLKDLQDEKPGEDGKVDWMMGRYNAWNVTLTSQCEQIQGEFRLLGDLARNALAQYNTLLEALSATITSNRESCLQYARGLG